MLSDLGEPRCIRPMSASFRRMDACPPSPAFSSSPSRADSAPGLVGIHLGGDERRVDADELYELYERIDADLERLRAQGLPLPPTAKGYCGE